MTAADFEHTVVMADAISDLPDEPVLDRPLGELLADEHDLSPDEIDYALDYQRKHGIRFGDAAIALGLVGPEDVRRALARQFHYHYAPGGRGLASQLVMASDPFSRRVEVFRDLRSQLLDGPQALDPGRRSVAVVSADAGDGRSFVAANLAIAFSQLPGRTLLIDADLRRPRQHRLFRLKDSLHGLGTLLAGRTGRKAIVQVAALPNLYVMPVGPQPPNPLELLQQPALGLLLRELESKFNHVVVDTSAAARGADARMVAARCQAALLVARRDHTRLAALRDFAAQLSQARIRVAAQVMNERLALGRVSR